MLGVKQNRGMTIIELMLVIGIFSILSAITLPSFSQFIERNRLKAVAESVKSDLQFARAQAITESSNVTFNRKPGDDTSWCYGFNSEATACDCAQTDVTQADYCDLNRVTGSHFKQTSIVSPLDNTTFDFRRGTANAGNVCLATDNYKVKVKVSNLGRVSICSDTTAPMSGYDACATNCT